MLWGKRIENKIINPNFKRRKNIVEDSIVFILKDNEKQIEIDGEFNEKGELLRTFPNASEAGRAIGILPSSMRNSIRRNGRCKNKLYYRYLDK